MIGFFFPIAIFLALVLIWFLFRSGGYKRQPLDAPPGRDWTLTAERFRDPQSGEMLEVWYCPRTGERAYVRAAESAGPSGSNLTFGAHA
jgi:hypothetical protein